MNPTNIFGSLRGASLIILLQFFFIQSFAQGWVKDITSYNLNEWTSVVPTSDGGYLLYESQSASHNAYLVKTDSQGDMVWNKTLNWWRNNYLSVQSYVEETPDFGFVMAGGTYNTLVAKISSEGDSIWVTDLGMDVHATQIINVQGGGYLVSATSTSVTSGDTIKIVLLKLDDAGQIQWRKTYGIDELTEMWSGTILQTADGNFLLGAIKTLNIPNGSGGYNLEPHSLVIKVDQAGDTLWTKDLGIAGFLGGISVLKESPDGCHLISGDLGAAYGGNKVIKTFSNFSFDWGINWCVFSIGYLLDITDDANVVVVGKENNTLTKLTLATGDVIWQDTLGVIATTVHTISDGGFIVTAVTLDSLHNMTSHYLIKLDRDGKIGQPTAAPVVNQSPAIISVFPNPLKDWLNIKCNPSRSGNVKIELFNMMGRSITVLKDEPVSAGDHSFSYNPDIPPGVYFLEVETDDSLFVQKLIKH